MFDPRAFFFSDNLDIVMSNNLERRLTLRLSFWQFTWLTLCVVLEIFIKVVSNVNVAHDTDELFVVLVVKGCP